MTILYIDWNMYGKADIIEAFEKLGHTVLQTDIPVRFEKDKKKLTQELSWYMQNHVFDLAFTSNYYPVVSEFCERMGKLYVSWIYDSPLIALYDPSVKNRCNYIFTFDSDECRNLQEKGVLHAFYMPLAVNPERLDVIRISDHDREIFSADVSLVASLYNEEHNLYDRMEPKLTEFTRGYLQGIMEVQKNTFGAFLLEEALNRTDIAEDMYRAMPYEVNSGCLTDRNYVYANYVLARKVANMQRMEYIDAVSRVCEMKVYSGGDLKAFSHVKHMGTVDYLTDMNKVFRLSRINLNITLPSIHTGIPLRAMDIMGNGGFLLTNYQADLFELFEPDVDFVYYTSKQDMLEKIAYYLKHEDERRRIADHAHEKMRNSCSFADRIRDMLYIVANA